MASTMVITGASSGIGYEFARVSAGAGHNLVLIARREERLRALQAELEAAHGVRVWTYQGDLTQATVRQAFADWVLGLNLDLYGLVNNAGFGDLSPFAKADWDKLNQMLQLNIVALTHLTHLFLPSLMGRKRGRILNVASTAAFLPGPYMAVYYASKAYVLSFTEAMATELEGTGITATTLCPGPTQSEFQDAAEMGDVKMVQNMNRLPTAAEVAHYGYTAMEQGERLAVHGLTNQALAFITRLLPRKTLAAIAKQVQSPQ